MTHMVGMAYPTLTVGTSTTWTSSPQLQYFVNQVSAGQLPANIIQQIRDDSEILNSYTDHEGDEDLGFEIGDFIHLHYLPRMEAHPPTRGVVLRIVDKEDMSDIGILLDGNLDVYWLSYWEVEC